MNHHDPQNTGRSGFLGPQLGLLDTIIDTEELYSGFVIGADSTIYFTSSGFTKGGLFAYTPEGKLKWRSYEGGYSYTAPIVSRDGTIYYLGTFALAAINPDGTLKWQYKEFQAQTLKLFTIDKEGNLYFLDGFASTLKVINKKGELIWSITDPQFGHALNLNLSHNFSFSPNGNTIYLSTIGNAITAIDIKNKLIKWQFGEVTSMGSVIGSIINNDGNIYLQYEDNTNKTYFTSLNEDGVQRWKYNIHQPLNEQPTIDRNGNIYFATDTLYSFDYQGNLRWKIFLNGLLANSLVCDASGNIYLSINGQHLKTMAFDSNGSEKWVVIDSVYGTLSSSSAIFNNKLYIPSNNREDFYIIK
jgi:sugar lactone lactonase YvrE